MIRSDFPDMARAGLGPGVAAIQHNPTDRDQN